MGYLIRINNNKNYCFWITWENFDKKQKIDDENYKRIKDLLKGTKIPKKRKVIDLLILFIASIPWIIFVVGILTLFSTLYYIFYLI